MYSFQPHNFSYMKLLFQSSPFLRPLSLRALQLRSTATQSRAQKIKRPSVASMKVDAHVHVLDPNFPTHPDNPLPPIHGTASDLVANMDAASVDTAIIVQPINYKFNYDCIRDAIERYPKRFALVALADTTIPTYSACAHLQNLVKEGFRGLRINPTFTDDGFRNSCVAALVRKAGELDIPIALFAQPKHLQDVENLAKQNPQTKLVLDHFAFASSSELPQIRERVIDLAKYGNIYVKASAWFRVSEKWPHTDLHGFLKSLIDTYGAERLLLGSDYPFVKEKYDYNKAMSLLDETFLSEEERHWIEGGTAEKLYRLG